MRDVVGFDPARLVDLVTMRMPFGRYQGRCIADLPPLVYPCLNRRPVRRGAMSNTAWQPTKIRRFEAAYASSTMPIRVITDQGSAYLKAINNPMGPGALVRDLVG